MKKHLTAAAALALGLLTSQAAWAQPGECDRYNTAYDQTYCFAKLFLESDKELNEVYKSLRGSVSGDTRQGLTEVQRNWIRHRDATCQPEEGRIDVQCNYRLNRERAEYLRDRLRECKAGTCRNDMITRPSW